MWTIDHTDRSHRWRWCRAGFSQPMRRLPPSASEIRRTICPSAWRAAGWWTDNQTLWLLPWRSESFRTPAGQIEARLKETVCDGADRKTHYFEQYLLVFSFSCFNPCLVVVCPHSHDSKVQAIFMSTHANTPVWMCTCYTDWWSTNQWPFLLSPVVVPLGGWKSLDPASSCLFWNGRMTVSCNS